MQNIYNCFRTLVTQRKTLSDIDERIFEFIKKENSDLRFKEFLDSSGKKFSYCNFRKI
jgi:hypothetical protein